MDSTGLGNCLHWLRHRRRIICSVSPCVRNTKLPGNLMFAVSLVVIPMIQKGNPFGATAVCWERRGGGGGALEQHWPSAPI